MQTAQFEASVIALVRALRSGVPIEDDRVELKQTWPGPDKARQLAGAANRAAGEYLTYIIGLDENGQVFPVGGVDPATWWDKMQAEFDDVSPELVRHLVIQVAEGEVVVALQFLTDRAPYMVKLANAGRAEREVPIREGTRTRSAFRHELLRLLYPPSIVPSLHALEGRLMFDVSQVDSYTRRPNPPTFELFVRVYFECSRDAQVFMPIHQMRVELMGQSIAREGEVSWFPPKEAALRRRGALLWPDGIELVGPGSAEIAAVWRLPDIEDDVLAGTGEWQARLSLPVAGTAKSAVLTMRFGGREELRADAPRYLWDLQT